jgi:hypothetical protein
MTQLGHTTTTVVPSNATQPVQQTETPSATGSSEAVIGNVPPQPSVVMDRPPAVDERVSVTNEGARRRREP